MKNLQLLKILGEIDDKFYDEALGGDTEKPLKIDVSRKPLRWYNIAAPIAACLVLGAGVFTLSRYFNNTGVIPGPITSDSDPIKPIYTSATEADIDACRQLLVENKSDLSEFTARIMDINFDGVDEVVFCLSDGMSGIYIFSKCNGEMIRTGFIDTTPYRYCVIDPNLFKEYDPAEHLEGGSKYWYFLLKCLNYDTNIYAEAVARITYDGASSYDIDFPAAAYATDLSDVINNVTLKKNWSYFRDFNCDPDAEDTGVEISKNEFASIWEKHFAYEELDQDFIRILDADDPYKNDVDKFFPTIYSAPVVDMGSFGPDTVKTRGKFRNIVVHHEASPTDEWDEITTYAALAGENVHRFDTDSADSMRMDRLSVILYKEKQLLAQVYLDELFGVNSSSNHGNMHLLSDFDALKYYQFDDFGIFVINNDSFDQSQGNVGGFAALTKEGKLILLKGIYESVYETVYRIGSLGNVIISGNSLVDTTNGTEYHFFPDRFENAEPDAEHPHFMTVQYFPSDTVKGGTLYNADDTGRPESLVSMMIGAGTEVDLERWKEFVKNAQPAVVSAVFGNGKTQPLSDEKANALHTIIQSAHLEVVTVALNPPTGIEADYPEIYAYDSDGNVLYIVFYNGVWVDVAFEGQAYRFDGMNGGIDSIKNFLN